MLWALLWDRARGRRRCPKCWYDMAGVPGMRCPECGREAKSERRLGRTRRRWRWAATGALAVLAGGSAAAFPTVQRDGWTALVPVPVMLRLMSYFEKDATTAFDGVVSRSFVGTTWTSTSVTALPRPTAPPGLPRWDRLLLARRCVTLLDGPGTRTKMDVLLPMGRGSHPTDWGGVALILPMLGPEGRFVVPSLRRRVCDTSLEGFVRLADLELLERASATSANLERACALVVSDSEPLIRHYALNAIRTEPPAMVVPVLIKVLHDSDPLMRRYAADGLWRIGPEANGAIDELRAVALDDPDRTVQMAASAALSRIRRAEQK